MSRVKVVLILIGVLALANVVTAWSVLSTDDGTGQVSSALRSIQTSSDTFDASFSAWVATSGDRARFTYGQSKIYSEMQPCARRIPTKPLAIEQYILPLSTLARRQLITGWVCATNAVSSGKYADTIVVTVPDASVKRIP